jgi:hypothetical protein
MMKEPSAEIRITREELHRLVWSKTLRKIREEVGTTYVELIKACTAMNVPRPVSGEWERIRVGQAVARVPLPEAHPGVAVEFFLKRKGTVSEEELPPLPQAPQAEEEEPLKTEAGAQILEPVVEPVGNRGPVTLTRQELYEGVWKFSLSRLVKEWGTSQPKICPRKPREFCWIVRVVGNRTLRFDSLWSEFGGKISKKVCRKSAVKNYLHSACTFYVSC